MGSGNAMSTFWTVVIGWVVAGAVVALIFGRIARFGDGRTGDFEAPRSAHQADEQLPGVGLPSSMR